MTDSLSNKSSTLELSSIVAGLWRLADWQWSPQQTNRYINQCVEIGVSSFDNADIYGDYQCETLFGNGLKLSPSMRQNIQLVTKCGICLPSARRAEVKVHKYNNSFEYIISSAELSLKQLNTDYLDCLLIHRPNPLMDAQEVARAFSHLKQQGKILHAGVSNFLPHQFELLQSACDFPLAVNQIEVSVLQTQSLFDGSLDQCQKLDLIPMAWSPMGGGELFGAHPSPQVVRVLEVMNTVANDLQTSLDQVAVAWLLKHPAGIKPVIGSGKIERIANAMNAAQCELSDDHWFQILVTSQGQPIP